MPKGGARTRSGPQPDPASLTSARKGLTLGLLPREGYAGEAPAWPLANPTDRELELWVQTWTLPQAAAWSSEPWRWRTVAQWVRWSVRMESPASIPVVGTLVLRLHDEIGLTVAGLKHNGWAISRDEVQLKRDEGDADATPTPRRSRGSARDRLRVASG